MQPLTWVDSVWIVLQTSRQHLAALLRSMLMLSLQIRSPSIYQNQPYDLQPWRIARSYLSYLTLPYLLPSNKMLDSLLYYYDTSIIYQTEQTVDLAHKFRIFHDPHSACLVVSLDSPNETLDSSTAFCGLGDISTRTLG